MYGRSRQKCEIEVVEPLRPGSFCIYSKAHRHPPEACKPALEMSYLEPFGDTSATRSSIWIGDDFPLYQYASLPDEKNCVRLVELLPESNHDHIRCKIHIEVSRPFRAYEAISYCWGDPYDTGDIQCEGKILGVPRNLRDALEHFRLPDRPRILWADAICINQSDKKEQGHQVMQMGRIFKDAECVLIWLGRGTGIRAQAAFDWITCIEPIMLVEPKKLREEENHVQTIKGLPEEPWKDLNTVLWHAWFERIWVLQEVGLAERAILFCGRAMIDWKTFSRTCTWLSYQPRLLSHHGLEMNQGRLDSVYAMYTMGFKGQIVDPQESIYNVLMRAYHYKSTDPRDKVYALLGHAAFVDLSRKLSLESFVPIKYSSSPFDTFLSVATVLLKFSEPLRVLQFVYHERDVEEDAEDFISWVPQWAWEKNPVNILESPNGIPDFIRHSDPRFEVRGRQLHISGGILDSVIYSSEKFHKNPFKLRRDVTDAAHNRVVQIWNDLKGIMDGHSEQDVFQDLCDSVTAGAAIIYYNDDISLSGPQNRDSVKAELLADFLLYLSRAGAQFSNRGVLERLKTGKGDLWRLWEYGGFLRTRCIFVTAGGRLGIGSGIMKTGDLVCFFYGARFPCILRPAPEKLGYWFIGQCYISGVEKMAAMKQAELGNLKEDTFVLY